jgi:hypothetical protein
MTAAQVAGVYGVAVDVIEGILRQTLTARFHHRPRAAVRPERTVAASDQARFSSEWFIRLEHQNDIR